MDGTKVNNGNYLAVGWLALFMLAGCDGDAKKSPAAGDPKSPEPAVTQEAETATPAKLEVVRPDDRKAVNALRQQGATLVRNSHGNVVTVELPEGATDADLAMVARLHSVRSVDISGAKASLHGMAQLASLAGLETLIANRTQINDEVLQRLAKLRLREFSAANCPIGDPGMAVLAKQGELQRLDLSWTRVTAAGVAELTPLQQLETLNLSFTEANDATVDHLAKLGGLKTLALEGADISLAALKKLRQQLPNARIVHSALAPSEHELRKPADESPNVAPERTRIET